MLVDERTYQIRPGCMGLYLARHREIALPLMRDYLGEPLAYFTTVEGELNQFVHLWAYREDTGQTGWVLHQSNRLMTQLDFAGQLNKLPAANAPG